MHAHLYIQYMHTSQFPLYAHMYVRVYVYEYFHMAVYICSCLPLFSFLSLLLQSLLLHNILELEPSWAELWVAWLLAWFALALGCATRLSQRDMQTQANKVHTHTCTHIQTKHRRARHTCSWPFPRSCSELLARLSLSLFVSSMFGSTTTTTAAKSTTAAPTATVACVSIIFCRAWHWKRDKRAENNVPIPAAEDRRAANSNRNQCRTRN